MSVPEETTVALIQPSLFHEMPWGKAHPLRGANHDDVARQFVADNPVDSILSVDDFDAWAQRHGLLNVPTGAPRDSDAWMAHCRRRTKLRYRINKGGSHPRMQDGSTPFVVEMDGQNRMKVRGPEDAAACISMQRSVQIVTTRRRQLRDLLQSKDAANLPPDQRRLLNHMWQLVNHHQQHAELLNRQWNESYELVAAGLRQFLPQNADAQGLLSESVDADEENGE